MAELIRFGVSMDQNLVELLDKYTKKRQFPSRSETIRSLVREQLISEESNEDEIVTATISLVFDYRTTLSKVPIFSSIKILSNLQMHLDKEMVIKILVVSGQRGDLKHWADQLISQKDVLGKISIIATDSLYKGLKYE